MKRLLSSFVIAVVINFFLFFMMKSMVSPKQVQSIMEEAGQSINFIAYEPSPEVNPMAKQPQIKAPLVPKKIPRLVAPKAVREKPFNEKKAETLKATREKIEERAQVELPAKPLEPLARPVLLQEAKLKTGPQSMPQEASAPTEALPSKTNETPLETDVSPLVRIPPRYPPWALRSEITGIVVIQFTITGEGLVSDPRIIKSEPNDVFDQAALRALKQWKFKAKFQNGHAIARRAIQRFNFALRKG